MYKKSYLKTLFLFCNFWVASCCFAQDINKSIIVQFDKIKPNVREFNVEMKATYSKGDSMISLQLTVPNYILRYKTTLADYIVFEAANETIKFQNKKEFNVEESSICQGYVLEQIYTFTCSMPLVDFHKLLKNNLQEIAFYFAPNKEYIDTHLANEKFMHKDIVKLIRSRANKTLKYKAFKPNAVQYEKLITWVEQLQPPIKNDL